MSFPTDLSNKWQQPSRNYCQQDLITVLRTRRARRLIDLSEPPTDHTAIGLTSAVIVLEANGSVQSMFDWAEKFKLDREQRRAFEIFCATFVLSFYVKCPTEPTIDPCFSLHKQNLMKLVGKTVTRQHQLLCLLHGPGGSGKTFVLHLFLCYAKQFCSFLEGFTFTPNTIRITAMSSVAATAIGGEPTQSALFLNKRTLICHNDQKVWAETRMLIIDKISFASANKLKLIYQRLRDLKNKDAPFGGLHVIFAGDMYQLGPIVGHPLHNEHIVEFNDNINCFIDLQGTHRFAQDPEWGEILGRFRIGQVTNNDLALINERVVTQNDVPANIRYATYCNKERVIINKALFEKHCLGNRNDDNIAVDAVVIYSDEVKVCTDKYTYVEMKDLDHFWNTCEETHISEMTWHGKMDPVLRLYAGCMVMFPYNKDISSGIARGTEATVEKIKFTDNALIRYVLLSNGVKVRAVLASEIFHITVKHARGHIVPNRFFVTPTQFNVTITLLVPRQIQTNVADRKKKRIQCQQIPLLISNASTGYSLQGMGVDQLFLYEWQYPTNWFYLGWLYLVLSRVKSRKGLFLRKALTNDTELYKPHPTVSEMLQDMETKQVFFFTAQEYEAFPKTQNFDD